MEKQITQVPSPGSSGLTPTGAMQFRNDWPGLFIRGDVAILLHTRMRGLQQQLAGHPDAVVFSALVELGKIADIIERDVIVQGNAA